MEGGGGSAKEKYAECCTRNERKVVALFKV